MLLQGSNGVSALHEGCWWSDFPANDLAVRQVLGLNTFKMQVGVFVFVGVRARADVPCRVQPCVVGSAATRPMNMLPPANPHAPLLPTLPTNNNVCFLFTCLCVCVRMCACVPQPGVPPSQLGGGGAPSGACWSLAQLVLEDFAYFGDGCIFLDMVRRALFVFVVLCGAVLCCVVLTMKPARAAT